MTTKPPPLKVHGLTIRHVMGIEEMEIAPGAVTLIEGCNGSGKSSVVEAIRSVLGRGHDATLVRKGSEKAEVVLILDNGMEIRREVDATGGTRVVATHPEMGRIAQPAGWLRGMVDGMWSPIELLRTANAKQRVQMLLEAMPLPVTPELATKVEKIIGHPPDAITTDHALEAIGQVRQSLYSQRTGANRVKKQSTAYADELEATLPAGAAADTDLGQAIQEKEALEADLHRKLTAARAADGSVRDVEEREYRHALEVAEERYRDAIAFQASAHAAAESAIQDDMREKIVGAAAEVSKASEQARTADLRSHTLATITDHRDQAASADKESKGVTASIRKLDALKATIAKTLPIVGVTVEDGDVAVDGVPWPRVNRARRVQVAVGIARLRAGKIPLIVIDGAENLDAEHLDAVTAECREHGLQAILTRVTEGPLTVRDAS